MQKRIQSNVSNMSPGEKALRKSQAKKFLFGQGASQSNKSRESLTKKWINKPLDRSGRFQELDKFRRSQRNNPTMILERKLVKLA